MLHVNLLELGLIFSCFVAFICCGLIYVNCFNFILDKINDIAAFVCPLLLDFYIMCKMHSILILFSPSRVNKYHFVSRIK